jgi:two-component system, sensor histidine kinase and response regulator
MTNSNDPKTILIIDDTPMNLILTSKSLESEGYQPLTALSGEEGFRLMEEQMPDLILLDISMPVMDGYEVCERLKADNKLKDIPVIFVTANALTEDLVKGFAVGGVDYITKPFKKEELLVRIRTHIELSESRRKIVEMNYNRDKLYSIIAHDIRSPLSGILQTIDAIDQGFISTSDKEFMEIIRYLSDKTRETHVLLNSLLQWTKLQTNGSSLQPVVVELNFLLTSCVKLLHAVAQAKHINISIQEGEYRAVCDEMSMHTVFRNLVSNAVKFSKPGGSINISFGETPDAVKVTVSDEGVGMSSDVLQKIFVNDEHFSSSGTENEQGTGLGLMIVKDFVRKNNANIQVESELDKGTRITVTIPRNF